MLIMCYFSLSFLSRLSQAISLVLRPLCLIGLTDSPQGLTSSVLTALPATFYRVLSLGFSRSPAGRTSAGDVVSVKGRSHYSDLPRAKLHTYLDISK